jgi:hypothetical protein
MKHSMLITKYCTALYIVYTKPPQVSKQLMSCLPCSQVVFIYLVSGAPRNQLANFTPRTHC